VPDTDLNFGKVCLTQANGGKPGQADYAMRSVTEPSQWSISAHLRRSWVEAVTAWVRTATG